MTLTIIPRSDRKPMSGTSVWPWVPRYAKVCAKHSGNQIDILCRITWPSDQLSHAREQSMPKFTMIIPIWSFACLTWE
jgi:hypothetical protein